MAHARERRLGVGGELLLADVVEQHVDPAQHLADRGGDLGERVEPVRPVEASCTRRSRGTTIWVFLPSPELTSPSRASTRTPSE